MADIERSDSINEVDPKRLIDILKNTNRQDFDCSLIMLVPIGSEQAVILLPVSKEYPAGSTETYYGAFGVHPTRGLILIQGEAAKKLDDFFQNALDEISLTEPSEITFEFSLDELFQKHPGVRYRSSESKLINLMGPDDHQMNSWSVRDSWSESYILAQEYARQYSERIALRRKQLSTTTALIS